MQEIDLNKIWVNPFNLIEYEIKPPFEILNNENDKKLLNINFVVDYQLFLFHTVFNPNINIKFDKNLINITIIREYPPDVNVYYSNGKIKKIGYHINDINKSLSFIVERIERNKLFSKELQTNPKIKKMLKWHKYVISFGNMKLLNPINDKITVGDNPDIIPNIREKLNIYNDLFMKYIADSENYPKYIISEKFIKLSF